MRTACRPSILAGIGSLAARTSCFGGILCRLTYAKLKRHITTGWRHPQIALHLLVQRRTEIGTIERKDTCRSGLKANVCVSPGIMSISALISVFDGKTVWHIPVLLQVGHMEKYGVAYFNPSILSGAKMRADSRHIYMHFVALPFYPCLTFALGSIWVLILFYFKDLQRIGSYLTSQNGLGIVRFS